MTMSTISTTVAPDRRAAGREMVRRLLQERREMLVLFCRVAGLDPFSHDCPGAHLLPEFCQVLVDYMAAAHFSLYRRIVDGTERRQAVLGLAADLYPRIEASTESAILFNDKYDCVAESGDLVNLHKDLSELGEALATRVELEDRLIAEMLRPRRS